MLNKKEFEILYLMTQTGEALSQRAIAEGTDLSLGTVNKAMKQMNDEGLVEGGRITPAGYEALEPYRVRRAVLLAADFDARLMPAVLNTPKALMMVQGRRIIDRLLEACAAAEIKEIILVRGYRGELFSYLTEHCPGLRLTENPAYNESGSVTSALCAGEALQNAYVADAGLLLQNPGLIRKYEYQSHFVGVPVQRSDSCCFRLDPTGQIIGVNRGGMNCFRSAGLSYWTGADGEKLLEHLQQVAAMPGGRECSWQEAALTWEKERCRIMLRTCRAEDVVQIDTMAQLKELDPIYQM